MSWWNDVDEVLGDVPHAVVGAVAANAYQASRATFDLDVAIQARDQEAARVALTAASYEPGAKLDMSADPKQSGRSWTSPNGNHVDIIALAHRWASRAIAEAQTNRPASTGGLPVMPLPYLAIMKATASRANDTADLQRMLGAAALEQWEAVRRAIAQWRPQDLEDVDALRQIGLWERGAANSHPPDEGQSWDTSQSNTPPR